MNIGEIYGMAPRLGDDAYLGPCSKFFGGISVGKKVAVGANAVVRKDVPENTTVGGIPARIISSKGAAGLVTEAWEMVIRN